MKNLLLLAALTLTVSLATAQQNGGLFSGITNAFNNFFGGSDNTRQPQRRPPQQFQQQQQQFQPQQQQFQPQQQQFQPQQQQFQPQQQQQFQQQPSFQPRPSSQGSFNQAPVFRPQVSTGSQVRNPAPAAQSSPSFSSSSNSVSGGTAKCGAQAPNHFWQGKSFVVTWKFGCRDFEQHEAREYCQSMGMEPVSLDTPEKQNEFNRLIAQDAQRFFWTGGIVDHANQLVGWSNPSSRTIRFSDSVHWSHTGGAGLPQPDNRAAGENPPSEESCLAILNNFYADGIKWHDVACHHKKPTVCEQRN